MVSIVIIYRYKNEFKNFSFSFLITKLYYEKVISKKET